MSHKTILSVLSVRRDCNKKFWNNTVGYLMARNNTRISTSNPHWTWFIAACRVIPLRIICFLFNSFQSYSECHVIAFVCEESIFVEAQNYIIKQWRTNHLLLTDLHKHSKQQIRRKKNNEFKANFVMNSHECLPGRGIVEAAIRQKQSIIYNVWNEPVTRNSFSMPASAAPTNRHNARKRKTDYSASI